MSSDIIIVEVVLPESRAVLLQSLLQGEDGLATIRCLDPEKKRQQFWTTPEQKDELYDWINTLPDSLAIKITGQWTWREKAEGESE
jgi:hypothetical protein